MEKMQKMLMKELFAVIEKDDKKQIEGFCKILKLPDAIDTWDYITKSNFPSMVKGLYQIGVQTETKVNGITFFEHVLKIKLDIGYVAAVILRMSKSIDIGLMEMVIRKCALYSDQLVRILLQRIDIDKQNENGMTAVLMACERGNVIAFQALVLACPNMYATDKDQNTCLHLLLKDLRGTEVRRHILRYLLKTYPLLVSTKNKDDETALDILLSDKNIKDTPQDTMQLLEIFKQCVDNDKKLVEKVTESLKQCTDSILSKNTGSEPTQKKIKN